MRNLKRALSLALASVMLLGMMVVGTGAFEDVTEAHNEEAIAVMELAGIMIGDDKGNFNPDQKVTRNEMAVIMSNMLGLDVADYAGTAPFTDVPAWAEAYVSACYANDIVSGTSATTYTGDAEVKAVDAGLMVMKALGYFQYASDFGTDYKVATIKKASEIDLFDDIKAKTNEAMTRNEVAQLCLNALETKIVSYVEGDLAVNDNGQLHNVYQYYTGNTELYEDLYEGELTKETATDDFGRPAVEWAKGEETVKVAEDADYVIVVDGSDETASIAAIVEDKEWDVAADAKVINATYGATVAYADAADRERAVGIVIEFFENDDDEIKKVVFYNYTTVEIAEVEEIDEEDELYTEYGATVIYTIDGVEYVDTLTESHDDYQAIGDYEKEDVLTVVMKGEEILYHELAKTVDGVKTAQGTGYVKLDGTKYIAVAGVAAPNYDDIYTYVQDPNGVLISSELKEEAEAAMEYVYILGEDAKDEGTDLLDGAKNEAVIKVMYLDGTVKTLAYELKEATKDGDGLEKGDIYFTFDGDKYEFSAATFKSTIPAGWVSYTMNGDAITVKTAVKDDASKVVAITANEDSKTLATGLYATTKTTVTMLNEDGVAETFTGYANFPKEEAAYTNVSALVLYKDTQAKAAYIYNASYEADDATTVDVAMYVESGDVVADGVVMTFYQAGKKVTYTVDTELEVAAGNLYEITVEDGIATLDAVSVDTYEGVVTVVSDDYIVIEKADETTVEIDLAEGCAVYQANKDKTGLTAGTLATEKNVTVIMDSEGEKAVEIFMWKA